MSMLPFPHIILGGALLITPLLLISLIVSGAWLPALLCGAFVFGIWSALS